MISLEITLQFTEKVNSEQIEAAALAALEHQGASQGTDLTIVIADDEQLRQFNRQYLDVDATTDVLAFPAGYTDPDTERLFLGDVIISYLRAQAQAEAADHAVSDELLLLVVHGVLHLLGHDHLEVEDKRSMWKAQEQILAQLGAAVNPPL